MPDSTVIQEFLVSLGFKLDAAQQQKFDAALASNNARAAAFNQTLSDAGKQLGVLGDQLVKLSGEPTRKAEEASDRLRKSHGLLTQNVKQLGLTAVATTSAFVTGFTEIARKYNDLYYIALRTGTTTGQVGAMQFAGSQAGGLNIAGAQASFNTTLQTQPGTAALMRAWGVHNVDEFEKKIAGMPMWLQAAYSEMVGLTYDFSRTYQNRMGAINASLQEYQANMRAAGVDTEKVFGDPAKGQIGEVGVIVQDLNSIWEKLNVTMVKGFDEAFPFAHSLLQEMNALGDANLKFIGQHPGAALAESLAAAYVSAVGILRVLSILPGGSAAGAAASAIGPSAVIGALWKMIPGFFVGHAVSDYVKSTPGSYLKEPGAYRPGMTAGQMMHPDSAGGLPHLPPIGHVHPLSNEADPVRQTVEDTNRNIDAWLAGSSAYRPMVQIVGWNPNTSTGASAGGIGGGPGGTGGAGGAGGPHGLGGGQGGTGEPIVYHPTAPGSPGKGDPRGMIPVIRAAAIANGLNPDDVLAVAGAEGLHTKNYATWDVNGYSYGGMQMHQGGLADTYQQATGKDPSDPKNEADMDTWAIAYAAKHGWGKWSSVTGGRVRAPRPMTMDSAGGVAAGDVPKSPPNAGGKDPVHANGLPPWMNDPIQRGLRGDATGQSAMEKFRAQLRGSPQAMLGGHVTMNHDAGDRHLAMNQTNHIVVQGGGADAGQRIAGHLNSNAGWMSANARTQLS